MQTQDKVHLIRAMLAMIEIIGILCIVRVFIKKDDLE